MKFIATIFSFMILLSSCKTQVNNTILTKSELVFDTAVTISLYENGSQEILDNAFELCHDYENLFSKTIETSEVGKLNSANGKFLEINSEVFDVIELSLDFYEISNNLFDVTIDPVTALWNFQSGEKVVPTDEEISQKLEQVSSQNILINGNSVSLSNNATIDLGGVAKGYIADRVKDFLVENGVSRAIINMGGNVQTISTKTDDTEWSVGIRTPFADTNDLSLAVYIDDMSVVTSGGYERNFIVDNTVYHHILDSTTGYPVESDLLSSTIICESSVLADLYSTTTFLLGLDESLKLVEKNDNIEAIFIDENYDLHFTSGIGENGIQVVIFDGE